MDFNDPYFGGNDQLGQDDFGVGDPFSTQADPYSSLWDPGVTGAGWDPTYTSYDYGIPAGGSGDASVISDYSDPGL